MTQHSFSTLERELTTVFSPSDGLDNGDVDSIGNLALLDLRDNAALNNSVFEVKRRHIIRRDKEAPTSLRAPATSSSSTTQRPATNSSSSGAPRIARHTSEPCRTVGRYLASEEVDL